MAQPDAIKAKLDKDVQVGPYCVIGPNVEVGENTVVAGLVAIAGSTKIGKNCMIGGSTGIAGHLKIGAGATIAAKSGVARDVPAGETMGGIPAQPVRQWRRSMAAVARLGKASRRKGG